METLETFTHKVAERIWQGKHLVDSKRKVLWLATFQDNKHRPIGDYKAVTIYEFLDYLSKEICLTDSTLNRYLSAISRIFRMAVEFEVINTAPKVRWNKPVSERPRCFTQQEEQAILTLFRGDTKTAWVADFTVLSINTGMRLGEILGINRPNARKTLGTLSDCGHFVTLSKTKNGEERLVALNSAAREALSRLNNCPSEVFNHRHFYNAWGAAREQIAPGDMHFVFHVCRHTCASRLAMDFNTNTIALSEILGHKSPVTTKKYVHADKDNLRTIMNQLEMRKAI